MSFDAHNLIVPSAEGVLPGGSKSPEASIASKADIKARFDHILQSQSDAVTPATAETAIDMSVDAVKEIAPIVLFPDLAIIDETLSDVVADVLDVAADFLSVAPTVAEAVPAESDLMADAKLVTPVVTETEIKIETASDSNALSAIAPPATSQTQGPVQAPAPIRSETVAKAETTATDVSAPDLDLAAALMAAQLAASEEAGQAGVAEEAADADLDAVLKTLPPELAALVQATAKPAPKPVMTGQIKDEAAKTDIVSEDVLALSSEKVTGASEGTGKTATDPALSAVKDITATAEGADAAGDAALPAVATSTQASTAQTAQSDAQALLNSLSNRLNGATSASSASSAATAQAYVMSNQTADNIAALAANISKKMDGKTLRFDMELRPSDMGRVDVRMEINADGKLSAHLSFDSPVAETEFRGRQDDLRRQLEQSGFNLEDGSLSFSSRDQNPQSSGRDQDERPAVTSTAASEQFSRSQDMADELALNGWRPGMDGFDSFGGGERLALNVRV
ncbi:flagellar hook-length control protein FliK [Asticcacaulis machinosus]|uniref:Flagellar hook-length control protein FliK n=1 Tax=Asticcacaulis machinosus TaxID=2984211 RepID=A0ABT5HJ34_9CAUL|nr:flagellar hook-length control protein FliK [Asticcacaulis machinosus]MDC7676249.1 flagellar hook-length control protein FliK [Asticcacaulis machinosus]